MSTLQTLQDILVAEFDLNRAQLTPEAPLTNSASIPWTSWS